MPSALRTAAAASSNGITRRAALRAGAAAPLAVSLACTRVPRPPLHVLVLVSDDQSRTDLGCYGNPSAETPHLDAFARQGCRFERAYTPVAICRPSRACLYTGLYPGHSGMDGFKEVRAGVLAWPELLGRAGWFTGCIGKQVVDPAFERFAFTAAPGGPLLSDGRTPAEFGAATRAFLEQAAGRPTALVVNFLDPHRGEGVGARLMAELAPGELERRAASVWVPPFLHPTREVRLDLALYHVALRRMDRAAGEVLRAWSEAGLEGDTLALFTSDNGADVAFAKTTLYEAGINLPFVVRWPSVVGAETTSQSLVSFVDVLPTILELGHAPVELDGVSLVPLLKGRVGEARTHVFGSHTDASEGPSVASRSVREGRWKYIRNFRTQLEFANGSMRTHAFLSMVTAARDDAGLARRIERLRRRPAEELYDLEADPYELESLAGAPAREQQLHGLRERLRDWMWSQEDPLLAEWAAG